MNRRAGHGIIFRDDGQSGWFIDRLAGFRVEPHGRSLTGRHDHLFPRTQHVKHPRSMRHPDGVDTRQFDRAAVATGDDGQTARAVRYPGKNRVDSDVWR